jgi:glutamyl-tRNA synthetase
MSNIRVRFAPSPTGYLHIGGARTALFNWLYARKNNGKFILRIEDTDQARNTKEAYQAITDSLSWLGLDWDEGPNINGDYGPYYQMQRLDLYKQYADKLIQSGHAYKCYCSEDDLNSQRESFKQKRDQGDKTSFFKYPGTCRDKSIISDKPYVVRFKAPTTGSIEYTDKVFGKIVSPNKENQDFVILRSDSIPLYNFGAVVDDITMKITLVARGRDHMINTPMQILLYNALGAIVPEFAHLPMMLSESGEKLSKRNGSVSVMEFRDKGYSPNAILNYLSRFGWSHGNQEIFYKEELINYFSWEKCGKKDGKIDPKKLTTIQFSHLKSKELTSNNEYLNGLSYFSNKSKEDLNSFLPLFRDRSKNYLDAINDINLILDSVKVTKEDVISNFSNKELIILKDIFSIFSRVDNWSYDFLKEEFNKYLLLNNLQIKDIGQLVLFGLIGKKSGPDFIKIISCLGKDKFLDKISSI